MSTPAPITATAVTADRARLQRRTLVVLVVSQVIGAAGVGVAPSIGVLLAGEVTDNEAWAGLARVASTLGAAVLGLPLGSLAAAHGRRLALSTGWWSAAAGAALLVPAAQRGAIVLLFAGLLLIGAGSAVTLQARFAATDLAPAQNKGKALSLVVWVGTIGSVLGPNLGLPGEVISGATGLTVYASAFLIAAICMAVAGCVIFTALRPDPLLRALQDAATMAAGTVEPDRPVPEPNRATRPRAASRIRRALAELVANPAARYAVIALLVAQVIMVAVMTMTPVHVVHHGGSVTLVGITISLHIVGMYVLSPVVGALVDRIGPRPMIGAGIVVFALSLSIGILKGESPAWTVAALILLGLGWSCVNVAGSTLFSRAVAPERRASAQGGVDALSNLCGAIAAFGAGPLFAVTSFEVLCALAAVVLVPLIVVTLRRQRPALPSVQ